MIEVKSGEDRRTLQYISIAMMALNGKVARQSHSSLKDTWQPIRNEAKCTRTALAPREAKSSEIPLFPTVFVGRPGRDHHFLVLMLAGRVDAEKEQCWIRKPWVKRSLSKNPGNAEAASSGGLNGSASSQRQTRVKETWNNLDYFFNLIDLQNPWKNQNESF